MKPEIKKYYSLLEITQSLESVIRKTYTKAYWVKAEIAKLNLYTHSGHCYPELVEKQDGKVLAQMRSTIWAGNFERITKKFREVTREELKTGMTVLLLGKINFHPVHGLALNITDIEPSFTLGEMAREKTASIIRLKKEGVFDSNRQLALPLLPKRIAIISVDTSKGYGDFTQIIDNNSWAYAFFHLLFPALLQGEGAVRSIREQLRRIRKVSRHFDLVVIIRGGGGDIGLSSYDNYELAKAVATFPLPVLTGIGHATNETVVEMVAHTNKITPSELAGFLIQQFHNFSVRIAEAQSALTAWAGQILQEESRRLDGDIRDFSRLSRQLLLSRQQALAGLARQVEKSSRESLYSQGSLLSHLRSRLGFKPLQLIQEERARLVQTEKELDIFSRQELKSARATLDLLEGKISLLKPVNVLKRGYSITTLNGKPLRDTAVLAVNDLVETRIFKGKFKSKIESVENEE